MPAIGNYEYIDTPDGTLGIVYPTLGGRFVAYRFSDHSGRSDFTDRDGAVDWLRQPATN